MKSKGMLLGMMIVAAILIMAQASVSYADSYSGAWLPNDNEDFFALKITTGLDASFFMYDWGESDSLELFSIDKKSGIQSVYFSQNNNTWYAGLSLGAQTLDLGNSLDFGFFFGDGTNSYYTYDLTVIQAGEVYRLNYGSDDVSIYTSDIAPVPIPASALFLCSGMVGLIGFGKRMRERVF